MKFTERIREKLECPLKNLQKMESLRMFLCKKYGIPGTIFMNRCFPEFAAVCCRTNSYWKLLIHRESMLMFKVQCNTSMYKYRMHQASHATLLPSSCSFSVFAASHLLSSSSFCTLSQRFTLFPLLGHGEHLSVFYRTRQPVFSCTHLSQ